VILRLSVSARNVFNRCPVSIATAHLICHAFGSGAQNSDACDFATIMFNVNVAPLSIAHLMLYGIALMHSLHTKRTYCTF
jgi:hypothetical protein